MTTEDSPVWLPVFVTEFVVISIINAITIAAFARIRHLRKHSTYLVINLTVADLLVGAVAGPLLVFHKHEESDGVTLPRLILLAIGTNFLIASQVNLSLISLERLHATLFPFRHCLIRKWLYFKIIVGSWLVSFLIAIVLHILPRGALPYVWASFSTVTLLVLAVCYIIIIVNVQRSHRSEHHGLIHTERKLSVTLLMVTGVSVLTILPLAVYKSIPIDPQKKSSNTSGVDMDVVLFVIYLASCIVNPLVYAIRMQGFRKAIRNLACKSTEPTRVNHLQPHTMP
ncbi:uncharacterized protein LOC110058125 [Orbicella faveolata]|uniref:uncharacterized protein LOC110058125 n=1 Tax=Orbicella faveolata TaxID=48498 RepID=UPI0009E2DCFD|nr:uncharacterized protein LOC110058125 [Orbicella faveolata]